MRTHLTPLPVPALQCDASNDRVTKGQGTASAESAEPSPQERLDADGLSRTRRLRHWLAACLMREHRCAPPGDGRLWVPSYSDRCPVAETVYMCPECRQTWAVDPMPEGGPVHH